MDKTKYELSISKRRYNGLKVIPDAEHHWFKYVDVDYDFETGLKFKKTDSTGMYAAALF